MLSPLSMTSHEKLSFNQSNFFALKPKRSTSLMPKHDPVPVQSKSHVSKQFKTK